MEQPWVHPIEAAYSEACVFDATTGAYPHVAHAKRSDDYWRRASTPATPQSVTSAWKVEDAHKYHVQLLTGWEPRVIGSHPSLSRERLFS